MLASSSNTPPPLTSPSPTGRSPSVDSTPVSTPVSAGQPYPHCKRSRDDDLFFNWHKKAASGHAIADDFSSDDLLFPPDDDEPETLPLFPSASPLPHINEMPSAASPIDIATSRPASTSTSPRNQQSNLTTQLRNSQERGESSMAAPEQIPETRSRQDSNMLGTTPYGARQIPMGNSMRRESTYGLSNSMVGGMSWGGMSMSSFIGNDMAMAGTSPYTFQSPSFHSSSYLPKMEANYMKDYVCCDIHLDSMHELLQHYEEAHAQQPTQTMGRTPKDQQYPSSRAANATSTAQAVQQQAQAQQNHMPQQMPAPQNQNLPMPPNPTQSPLFGGQTHDHIGTFDNLDDMDMDMGDGTPAPPMQQPQYQPQPQFGRQQPRGPSVNVNLANAFQPGQGLNSATPTTPHASQQGMGFASNPTVSSVNTPTLTTVTASQQTATPDPSQPSTPAELDPEFIHSMGNLGNMDFGNMGPGGFDLSSFAGMGNMNNGGSATIDNPEKRLLSKQGYGKNGGPNPAFTNAQNSELAKRVRESQLLNGLAGVGGFVGEEIKPFKCPVIGCEKAYKNQNGLKYHKQHGHQNQQLKENPDGTFSIVDPATSIPYPGTVGMEKEKPYRCEHCGKRYKNLNGLKYHRQHSPPCNPELAVNGSASITGLPTNLQNLNANVAGAGLVMNEGMGY